MDLSKHITNKLVFGQQTTNHNEIHEADVSAVIGHSHFHALRIGIGAADGDCLSMQNFGLVKIMPA